MLFFLPFFVFCLPREARVFYLGKLGESLEDNGKSFIRLKAS